MIDMILLILLGVALMCISYLLYVCKISDVELKEFSIIASAMLFLGSLVCLCIGTGILIVKSLSL